MLELNNLTVEADNKTILKDVNLSVDEGEVMVLFGPNGSGKTTLIKTIMGLSGYRIKEGVIRFKREVMNSLSVDERVKKGLGMMYQHPPKIRGVRLYELAKFLSDDKKLVADMAEKLSLKEHLERQINLDFSGGEMKRSELFQLVLQNPDFLLLDEPESGVDIENISLMGRVLDGYLKGKSKSALIITHTGYILDYIEAKRGCVMMDGRLWCVGSPKEMFEVIRKYGYEECKVCHGEKRLH